MKRLMFSLILGSTALGAFGSEPPHGCFRSVAEAATQMRGANPENARPETLGFWLQEIRHDRLLNRTWATVRSCGHPERPAVTVESGEDDRIREGLEREQADGTRGPALPAAVQVMRAGTLIRVLRVESNLRFETAAVAQSNGAIGERIRVRLVRSVENSGEAALFLSGTVRSADLIEVEN